MINIENITYAQLTSVPKFDLFICAVGNESRASYLASLLYQKFDSKQKICIKLIDHCNEIELSSFNEFGFQIINKKQLRSILSLKKFHNIIIDYSVMMKSLYAEILEIFYTSDNLKESKIYFSYTNSLFEKPSNDYFVKDIKPILHFNNEPISNTYECTLIISLGYERYSAIGIVENLEISYDNVIIFINKENDLSPHYLECINKNREFLKLFKSHQIIEINFYNFAETLTKLDSVIFSLNRKNRQVIISPLSVKTFSLLSMVISLKYSNTIFYNVTSDIKKNNLKKSADPTKEPYIYLVTH